MRTKDMFWAGLLTVGFATSAHAIPIEFVDVYAPETDVVLGAAGSGHEYRHYLTPSVATNSLSTYIDGVLAPGAGYDSAADMLESGTLSLWFSGATGPWENGRFDLFLGDLEALDKAPFSTVVTVADTVFDVNLITSSGVLDVLIERTNASGTVNLHSSVLQVLGERRGEAVAVPEPSTVALLAAGLLTLVFCGARRRRA